MKNDIKFIRDDIQEKKLKELQEILDILGKKPVDMDVDAATRFFYGMLRASARLAEKKKEAKEKEKKIEEIQRKQPPKTPELAKEASLHKIWKETPPKQTITPPKVPQPGEEIPLPKSIEPEEIPKIEDVIKSISSSYPLVIFKTTKGEAMLQINIVHKQGKLVYELTEPEIDFRLVDETKKLIQKKFLKDKKVMKDEKFLEKNIKKAFKKVKIDYTEEYMEEIKYFLKKEMLGLGRIDPLIMDSNVQTIICDGLNKHIKITLGPGLEVITNIIYTKKEKLDEQIKQLGLRIKQEISENNPTADGTFYHFKIHATLGMGEADSKFMIKRMP